jgi:polyisoprenyl-teichoic acid--peptidoglycan teichoic acid transferase
MVVGWLRGSSGGREKGWWAEVGLHVRRSVPRVLLLIAGSVVLPGMAHLAAGRRRAGVVIGAIAFTLLVVALFYLRRQSRTALLQELVRPGWLAWFASAVLLVALGWIAVVVSSYLVLRPVRTGKAGRAAISATLTLLCVLVAVPPLIVARYAYVQRSLITDVFPDSGLAGAVGERSGDPWGGRKRLNMLLIASDAGPDRFGVRTDSLVLTSIDVHSGNVVMFSLPRNLQNVPMPAGPLRTAFPHGIHDLLNSVYLHVTERPSLLAGKRDRGAEAVKQVVGQILGLPVDYYAMANLQGFQDFVDALGGVTLTVQHRLPIGGITANGTYVPPVGYIQPGRQRLDGYHALWYARSRRDSTDYARIDRQRCLIGAMVRQADPLTVLKNFQKLASATKRLLSTDIPRRLLSDLVELADKVRQNGQIRSLPFVPPLISTADPDYTFIRASVRNALAEPSPAAPTKAPAATAPQPTRQGGSGETGRPSRARPAAVQVVDDVCNLG